MLWNEREELLLLGQPDGGSSEEAEREFSVRKLFLQEGLLLMLMESWLIALGGRRLCV